MVKCITGVRMNMTAEILSQGEDPRDVSEIGTHEVRQDPRTGHINREWVPVQSEGGLFTVKCNVRGILDGGIRVAGTTERFDKTYDNIDLAFMNFPARYIISKRDRVTNIKNKFGEIIWVEEELDAVNGIYPATVFDVLGVTPITDFTGKVIEKRAMLARADLNVA